MGNSQGKESQPERRGHARRSSAHQPTSPSAAGPAASTHDRPGNSPYGNSRRDRGSRPDLSFLGIRTGDNTERDPALEPRRETKAEREARKLEKDRILRAQERERSLKEEGVDGGYLVTLGVYTGPEDFSKPMVRQLQVCCSVAPQRHQLMYTRSSVDLLPSGEVSMTTKILGRSISSSKSSTAAHCPPQMIFLPKNHLERTRTTTSAQHGTPAAQSPVSTSLRCPWALDPCPKNRSAEAASPLRTLPSPSLRLRLRSQTTPLPRHSSVDAPKHLPPSRPVPATLRSLTWPHKNYTFPKTHT